MWVAAASFPLVGIGSNNIRYHEEIGNRNIILTIIGGFFLSGRSWVIILGPVLLTLLCLVWVFAIVADSAQFSAAISELADKEYIGTALTLQTSLGFLLTLVTIRLVPTLESWVGWQWAFLFLASGPLAGIWAMAALRGTKESLKLAGGKKEQDQNN
jgi:MFS family permease